MIDIAFVNETEHDVSLFTPFIEKIFEEVTILEKIDRYYEVSVIFVSKEKIREINRLYRNIDKVTDVISFALFDEDDIIEDTSIVSTLGDIFICLGQAFEQAKRYNHSKSREVGFLSCHGLLHLLGYDHDTLDEEEAMFSKQKLILDKIKLTREEENETK